MSELEEATRILRRALSDLPAGLAWPAGKIPKPSEIFTPRRHKNVLDVTRSLVVGNRGVGKTFWSHALLSEGGREVAANAYGFPNLRTIDAVFGYKGTISDEFAPSPTVIASALTKVRDVVDLWQAILLRCYGEAATQNLPTALDELASWFSSNPEEGEGRIRKADELRMRSGRPLVVLFDALDTLATDWTEIRRRTEGLLRLAVLSKGLSATYIKIFMRPDQLADAALFRFPDASKLRAERVELQWSGADLYGLMFFVLRQTEAARKSLDHILSYNGKFGAMSEFVQTVSEIAQRAAFEVLAGQWMGSNKKRGATYSWLVQHLADAKGETTPRGFLTALRTAADHEPAPIDQVIDYRGIQQGVAEASDNRVDDLRQDYWWIDHIGDPLAGLETPLERQRLFEAWRAAGTARAINAASETRGLPPVYLALRPRVSELPQDLAAALESDESAILETLKLIGLVEIRSGGKVNVPDIFRVAFKMKRRGGVPPKRSAARN